jgi:hypothetical protein
MRKEPMTAAKEIRALRKTLERAVGQGATRKPAADTLKARQPVRPPSRKKLKVISESSARTMVYLPLAWKEKFREIAYYERRKENDLSLEAFRDFLAKKGHKVD